MPVYLNIFHGRNHPSEELDDWGFDGPVVGPLASVGWTYGNIRLIGEDGRDEPLLVADDLIAFEGKFYGDFAIETAEDVARFKPDKWRLMTLREFQRRLHPLPLDFQI